MRITPILAAATLAGLAFATPAPAQTSAPGATGGAGAAGGPATTGSLDAGRSTTGTGQTKPGGDTLDARDGTTPELENKSRDIDRKIINGICRGCQ